MDRTALAVAVVNHKMASILKMFLSRIGRYREVLVIVFLHS